MDADQEVKEIDNVLSTSDSETGVDKRDEEEEEEDDDDDENQDVDDVDVDSN